MSPIFAETSPSVSEPCTFIILVSAQCLLTSHNSQRCSTCSSFNLNRGLMNINSWKHLCICAGPPNSLFIQMNLMSYWFYLCHWRFQCLHSEHIIMPNDKVMQCECDMVRGLSSLSGCFMCHTSSLPSVVSIHWPITCCNDTGAALTGGLLERSCPKALESGILHHSMLWHMTGGARASPHDEVVRSVSSLTFFFFVVVALQQLLPSHLRFLFLVFLFAVWIFCYICTAILI